MKDVPRLTWHAGSVLPFASLWHTVHRVAAINAMRAKEFPFALALDGRGRFARRVDLLFNESLSYGELAPGEALSIRGLADSLGEPTNAFAWAHLGWLPRSSRCLLHPFIRICPACLREGFHSALFSLRLLGSCPIHRCEFVDSCLCGQRFDSAIDRQALLHAGCCACGRMAYFTSDTCRRPTLEPEAVKPLLPIAAWLQQMSGMSRPVPQQPEVRAAHDRQFMPSLTHWCEALGISYPANFPPLVEPISLFVAETPLRTKAGYRSAAARPMSSIPARGDAHREGLWNTNEATTVYRAMTRYIRRHVGRGCDSFVIDFMLEPNPLSMARKMQRDRRAMVAFAELLFCRSMERFAMERRWPYRRPHEPMWHTLDQLAEPALEHGYEERQGLSAAAKAWVTRQAAAAMVTHAWRRAQGLAYAAVRTGIANWSAANEIYCCAGSPGPLQPLELNWHSAPPPHQVTWASAIVGDQLRFVCSPATTKIDWAMPVPDKAARVAAWRRVEAERQAEVMAACRGPSLTWTARDGWQVLEAPVPASTPKRHRLIGEPGETERFWLFASGGRFVARSCQANVQSLGGSPREAVHGLRVAIRQFRRQYGALERSEKQARQARPAPCRADLERELDTQVLQCLCRHGFWGGAARFAELAVKHLERDRRLPPEARSEVCGPSPEAKAPPGGPLDVLPLWQ